MLGDLEGAEPGVGSVEVGEGGFWVMCYERDWSRAQACPHTLRHNCTRKTHLAQAHTAEVVPTFPGC